LIWTEVGRGDGFKNVKFSGWYGFVSWFPTGESRNYLIDQGRFGRTVPLRKWGAVELAARYSEIDLTSADIKGGREHNITLAANWYISPYLRVMANFIFVNTDSNADNLGQLEGDDRPEIFQMRLQYNF